MGVPMVPLTRMHAASHAHAASRALAATTFASRVTSSAPSDRGSPDLAVEVRSPSTRRRDEGVKLKLYDRSDVAEYWVIDPTAYLVRVYQRRKGRLSLAAELTGDSTAALTSPLLPGCSLPLAPIFAKVR